MKCASMKLASRKEQQKGQRRHCDENITPIFVAEESHCYSFPFFRRKSAKPKISLAVTNIIFPDDFGSFNTGSSLDKWRQKRSRLKSAKTKTPPSEADRDFCYETLETDLSLLLDLDGDNLSHDSSLHHLEYEVHTDIEQLLRVQEEEEPPKDKTRRQRRRPKNKKKTKTKTIKFSISKPPTPQTEQVIRVDVTANVEDPRQHSAPNHGDDDDDDDDEVIDGERKELKRNLNESNDEDFIVRCRQLALKQRKRRL